MKRLTSLFAAAALTLGMAACHSTDTDKNAAAVASQEATIDSMKMEMAKQRVVDSMENIAALEKEAAKATPARRSTTQPSRSGTNTVYSSGASYSNGAYATPDPVVTTPAKRGWSAKAKGAVIGAGAGAVGGAIINKKNRGAGAVIGGLGGAAIGTGVGAIIDRKKGR